MLPCLKRVISALTTFSLIRVTIRRTAIERNANSNAFGETQMVYKPILYISVASECNKLRLSMARYPSHRSTIYGDI